MNSLEALERLGAEKLARGELIRNDDKIENYIQSIKQDLEEKEKLEKLLKILKDKKVDLHLIDSIPKEDTSIYGVKAYNFCYLKHLTKEEFDIIKRWLEE